MNVVLVLEIEGTSMSVFAQVSGSDARLNTDTAEEGRLAVDNDKLSYEGSMKSAANAEGPRLMGLPCVPAQAQPSGLQKSVQLNNTV